jgi:hypothetical protein
MASKIAESLYEEFMPLAFENSHGRAHRSKRELDAWKRANRGRLFFFPAVVKRVSDLLAEAGDADMVQLVCLEAIRSTGAGFEAMKHLGPVMFDVVRSRLEVPDGAWRYALWTDQCDDRRARRSAEYWLGLWADCEDAYDRGGSARARAMLDKLVGLKDEIEELTF